jgi:chemotaxis protein MotA
MADPTTINSPKDISISTSKMQLDLNTVVGLLMTFVLIAIAIAIGNSNANFFNLPSFLIVVMGTLSVTAVSFSLDEFVNAWKVVYNSLFHAKQDPRRMAVQLMDMAVLAKKKGLLTLSAVEPELRKDPHLHKAVQLVTDGYKPPEIESILAQDLDALTERHRRSASILRRAAEISPAMGLIGTLIGLVQMLANLRDPETIGPAMAVALLTTFYGAILGTAVFSPMAAKLDRNSNDEAMIRSLVMVGMASIARQDNPRRLEIMLNSELPPSERIRYFD